MPKLESTNNHKQILLDKVNAKNAKKIESKIYIAKKVSH